MQKTKRLWILLGVVIFSTLFVLGWFGRELYRKVPPIPLKVQTVEGTVVMGKEDILKGQQAWQSIGGQQVGSIWGHGAYQAPDWSADWLHREALALRNLLAIKYHNKDFDALGQFQQAEINQRLQSELRQNTYDPDIWLTGWYRCFSVFFRWADYRLVLQKIRNRATTTI